MTSPYSDNDVMVDGMMFTDGPIPAIDEYGCTWVLQDLEGWFGGVDVRSATIDRPMTDGTYDGAAPFAGRLITITGALVAPTRAALQNAFDRIAGILSGSVRRGDLVVNEKVRAVTRKANVRLGGPIIVKRTGSLTAAFSVSLYANDPLRYGDTISTASTTRYRTGTGRVYDLVFARAYGAFGSSGIAHCVNAGNRSTWPYFQVGKVAADNILDPILTKVATGEILKVKTSLPVTIDTKTRRVTDSLGNTLQATQDSDWFDLSPGPNDIFFQHSGSGSAADAAVLTVTWSDAYS